MKFIVSILATLVMCVAAVPAQADVTTDINAVALGNSYERVGSEYHVSTTGQAYNAIEIRWASSTVGKDTQWKITGCPGSQMGNDVILLAGSSSFTSFGVFPTGTCFRLFGRSQEGQMTTPHTVQLRR